MTEEPVHLDELVRDSFADAQLLGRPAGLQVELSACDSTVVCGDRHRLKQLLLTLTDNAIKYTQPMGHLTMALNRKNGTAELTIANSGPGISREKLPRVFDRFYRGDPAHQSDTEGCGLGLSIAQSIVKSHQGTIQIVSDPDRLTTVTVRMPAQA
jgi:signal transduction histidine kinase